MLIFSGQIESTDDSHFDPPLLDICLFKKKEVYICIYITTVEGVQSFYKHCFFAAFDVSPVYFIIVRKAGIAPNEYLVWTSDIYGMFFKKEDVYKFLKTLGFVNSEIDNFYTLLLPNPTPKPKEPPVDIAF